MNEYFTTCGVTFLKNEKIDYNKQYKGHSQGLTNAKLETPLRATVGIESIYDVETLGYCGNTFYVPVDKDSKPFDNLQYVLAVDDGILKVVKGKLVLISNMTIVYSDINILKTGSVKRGQIIGTVKPIEGIGYGVTIKAYNGNANLSGDGSLVNLNDYYKKIPYIE